MKVSYKIVYSGIGVCVETFTVDCDAPEVAVRAYVEAKIKAGSGRAKVYPVEDKPLMEIGPKAKPTESKLFDGYSIHESDLKNLAHQCCGGKKCMPDPLVPTGGKFNTPGSTWIDHVSWEKKNSSLCVHFLRGGFIVYKSDYVTFDNFLLWVGAGGSAGEYYNANIKGLPVIKRS